MSAAGREKLRKFGIAPPGGRAPDSPAPVRFVRAAPAQVACPHCGSADTERLAEFGSTACKALYRCRTCREPFDYFKPI
jgi:ring-1,2-phenylacetyl-CoA epoxidase subunit PaaD